MRTVIDFLRSRSKPSPGYRKKERISRAEAVRRAVAAFLPAKPRTRFDFRGHPAFGSSKSFRREDSVELVRRFRQEWE
jgi:hypothetical protein